MNALLPGNLLNHQVNQGKNDFCSHAPRRVNSSSSKQSGTDKRERPDGTEDFGATSVTISTFNDALQRRRFTQVAKFICLLVAESKPSQYYNVIEAHYSCDNADADTGLPVFLRYLPQAGRRPDAAVLQGKG
jgi:hypothetical protein